MVDGGASVLASRLIEISTHTTNTPEKQNQNYSTSSVVGPWTFYLTHWVLTIVLRLPDNPESNPKSQSLRNRLDTDVGREG